jgi:hypothetical protein
MPVIKPIAGLGIKNVEEIGQNWIEDMGVGGEGYESRQGVTGSPTLPMESGGSEPTELFDGDKFLNHCSTFPGFYFSLACECLTFRCIGFEVCDLPVFSFPGKSAMVTQMVR